MNGLKKQNVRKNGLTFPKPKKKKILREMFCVSRLSKQAELGSSAFVESCC